MVEVVLSPKQIEALKSAKRRLARINVYLVIAGALPFVILQTGWSPLGLSAEESFSRSGAATSVLALVATAMLSEYRADFEGSGFSDVDMAVAFKAYRIWYDALYVVSIAAAAFASLIWGYGDAALRAL